MIEERINLKESDDAVSGLGRDRTCDLKIFSRSLVPTDLPCRTGF